jgi:hypothetical protein
MRYTSDWREFSQRKEIKKLIESKGLEAAKKEFRRQSVLNEVFSETNVGTVASVGTPAVGAGGVNYYIQGAVQDVSRFDWVAGITNNITGSNNGNGLQGFYFDEYGYNGNLSGPDYSLNHVNSMKTFRLVVVSQSNATITVPAGIDGLITASYSDRTETTNITGSILRQWRDAINTQAANAIVGGFTNTIAPNTLFSASLGAASSSLTVTNIYPAATDDHTTNFTSTTASITLVQNGLDTFRHNQSIQFNGRTWPYNTYVRITGSYVTAY